MKTGDPLLVWTPYWSGPSTTLDPLLVWTLYYSGPPTGLDPLLLWTPYWSGPPTGLDPLLLWTPYWSGSSTALDPLLVAHTELLPTMHRAEQGPRRCTADSTSLMGSALDSHADQPAAGDSNKESWVFRHTAMTPERTASSSAARRSGAQRHV
ncbi:hypothetical protein EYF80_028711 [Liparis tanakae]|uniref:Uncharacterized protein n=1 Tax=Liparis tanakae TaxID=230148 RepID=A0A4Z2H5C0_9TELE|nr:hypothetical protein EYF80_028711 [Liparis tanakae]